ncbi:uncharacterized protein DSM5745_01279 [Aspergillus mulundensis]|uniref:Protein kinase domain-containing protein n=1 Tax=Aspergillus mulundensis TaxID=1810919 RepID=A0A3D8T5X5_9EURO|nr:Uncharacterized protein DSM5745_01279 [Aspergillus mulundensis]RDW93957.1 Uncharacterized protein DSM5745_01279 [Aspergillus mulundensis]
MIKPEHRFFSDGHDLHGQDHEDPESETTAGVWDWEQLKQFTIKSHIKFLPPFGEVKIPNLANILDVVSPQVTELSFDGNGLLTGVSTDPEKDQTWLLANLPFSLCTSLADCRVVNYTELQELKRFGHNVVISSYEDENRVTQKVAFKFNVLPKVVPMQKAWDELNLVKSLPPHPNILPMDRVVLDYGDVQPRVLGFTTKYIEGGTLEDMDPNIPFRLEWLQQLLDVVDFLNLELGIMHQDIAPRKLLVDHDANKIILFDFNYAAVGDYMMYGNRDDIMGVVFTLYELITKDDQFAMVHPWDKNMDMVQSKAEWPANRLLDADVSEFRAVLNKWVAKRHSDGERGMKQYMEAWKRRGFTLPNRPEPPEHSVPFQSAAWQDGTPSFTTGIRTRTTAMELGQYVFRWERPPQCRLPKESRKRARHEVD